MREGPTKIQHRRGSVAHTRLLLSVPSVPATSPYGVSEFPICPREGLPVVLFEIFFVRFAGWRLPTGRHVRQTALLVERVCGAPLRIRVCGSRPGTR